MISYVGLIRGLNVGGKNKVLMADLREQFAGLGYEKIKTIGNTGVIFFTSKEVVNNLTLGESLTKVNTIEIKLATLTFEEVLILNEKLPHWWNKNPEWRHNVLFLLDSYEDPELFDAISFLNPEIEQAIVLDQAIFWSSSFNERKDYYKTDYAKLIKNKAYGHVTVRNGNTFKKIVNYIELNRG